MDETGAKHFPEFLVGLRSLREFKFTTEFSNFNASGEDYLVLIARCLTLLVRLQIIVVVYRGTRGFDSVMERIKYVAQTAGHRVPGMLCTPLIVDTLSYHPEVRLVFTWER
jgi:hypothetical protein